MLVCYVLFSSQGPYYSLTSLYTLMALRAIYILLYLNFILQTYKSSMINTCNSLPNILVCIINVYLKQTSTNVNCSCPSSYSPPKILPNFGNDTIIHLVCLNQKAKSHYFFCQQNTILGKHTKYYKKNTQANIYKANANKNNII